MNTRKVRLIAPASLVNKVSAIKNIRELTGLGLKEAKDASELIGVSQDFNVSAVCPEIRVQEIIRELKGYGFKVSPSIGLILDDLRKVATDAINIGEDQLAQEILQFVVAEKLRHNL